MKKIIAASLLLAFPFAIISSQVHKKTSAGIKKELFGKFFDSTKVYSYTLTNTSGMKVKVIEFGAAIVSLLVPDRNGKFADVVLGYDVVDGYVRNIGYFGVIVGRYANRIANGKFKLEGTEYHLTLNDGKNHLHGGEMGFSRVLWNAEPVESDTEPVLKLTYRSEDGEDGYPGTVTVSVVYTLTKDNELKISYKATTDKATIFNPTSNSYFNLTGDPTKSILEHELTIRAESYLPINSESIPAGSIAKVNETPFDFRKPTKIGLHINDENEQLKFARGYDHNWVLNGYSKKVRSVATLYDPQSGRYLEVLTDQPGLQLYTGNFLDGGVMGKNGVKYKQRVGLCLAAQHFPDSPNNPDWSPSVLLKPGETYMQTTIYKFSTK